MGGREESIRRLAIEANSEQYHGTIRELSERLVQAQRPIRILDAIKWDESVQVAFFASGANEQPPVERSYYDAHPLGYDPRDKRMELHDIERDVTRLLGQYNPVGQILGRMCREYQMVVRMLESRGTTAFSTISEELYGSASDAFHAGEPNLVDLAVLMSEALENIDRSLLFETEERTITSEQAVVILQERLDRVFGPQGVGVRVILGDGILADSAAGSDYIKIRREALFNERDLRLLEVHEGWVHIATTLNGQLQPVCTFLSKGPPSATTTQEGLAILMEIFTFASHPARLRRLTNRIRAVEFAENGASFLDIYRFFRDQGFSEVDSYMNASRVFRGSTPVMGPFTKDLSYSKGFILIYNYIRLAVRKGKLDRIPMLFCGKTTLEDIRMLTHLKDEGVVAPPQFLPPQFSDLSALTAYMCYSNFLNQLNLQRIEADYANIL